MHACIQLEWFSVRLGCVYSILWCVCTGSTTLVCSVGHSHEDIGSRTGVSPGKYLRREVSVCLVSFVLMILVAMLEWPHAKMAAHSQHRRQYSCI